MTRPPYPVTEEEMQEFLIEDPSDPDPAWSRVDWPRFRVLLIERGYPREALAAIEFEMMAEALDVERPTLH